MNEININNTEFDSFIDSYINNIICTAKKSILEENNQLNKKKYKKKKKMKDTDNNHVSNDIEQTNKETNAERKMTFKELMMSVKEEKKKVTDKCNDNDNKINNNKNNDLLKKILDDINKKNNSVNDKETIKYQNDPYLNSNDKSKFTNFGSGFTICFKEKKKKLSCSYNKRQVELKNEEAIAKKKEEEMKKNIIPQNNIRHTKILQIVAKFSSDSDANKKFLQVLNKLDLYDLKGLHMAIINYENIPIIQKQVLVETMKLFKSLLQKKMEQGYELHNDKKIIDLINVL
jgi:F0F1-type ATP synthase membrane subunit b/b'